MKKILMIGIFFAVGLNLSGCLKRVELVPVEKDRVDQELSGNKGFIAGSAVPEEKPESTDKRKIYQLKVEIPPYAEWKNFRFEPTPDKEISGNRGYVYGGPQSIAADKESYDADDKPEEIVLPKETPVEPEVKAQTKSDAEAGAYTLYEVQKGDTLQKIASKVYGSSKKWKKIFDFNQDKLKNPDKIYPGQKIKIPQE